MSLNRGSPTLSPILISVLRFISDLSVVNIRSPFWFWEMNNIEPLFTEFFVAQLLGRETTNVDLPVL
jgi:hypothetical protein